MRIFDFAVYLCSFHSVFFRASRQSSCKLVIRDASHRVFVRLERPGSKRLSVERGEKKYAFSPSVTLYIGKEWRLSLRINLHSSTLGPLHLECLRFFLLQFSDFLSLPDFVVTNSFISTLVLVTECETSLFHCLVFLHAMTHYGDVRYHVHKDQISGRIPSIFPSRMGTN